MRYFSNPSLHRYFEPILDDLKETFFSLSSAELKNFYEKYDQKYGKSAVAYAMKAYPEWRSGRKLISDQTLARILEVLPPFLSDSQRIEFLTVIVKHNSTNSYYYPKVVSIDAYWENYHDVAVRLRTQYIPRQINANNKAVLDSIVIPDEVYKMASWLYSDNMQVAYRILQDMYVKENIRLFKSALDDILLFENTCDKMQADGLIYQDVNTTINLPNQSIHILLHKTKKSFCVVSTACFGENAPQTIAFRKWRDEFLKNHALGVKFINWYYRNGYEMARFIGKHKSIKQHLTKALNLFYEYLERNRS